MRESRRLVLAVSVAVVLLIGVAGTYALVRDHESDRLVSAKEQPRVERARLFLPANAAPARDEIAATLAHEVAPTVWPEPKLPKRPKLVTSKSGGKSAEAIRKVPQNHKQRQAKKTPG
jgi:hypothetical protein